MRNCHRISCNSMKVLTANCGTTFRPSSIFFFPLYDRENIMAVPHFPLCFCIRYPSAYDLFDSNQMMRY